MSNRLQFEPLVNFDASTLNGTYQVINGTGTENALNIFKFYNSSANLVLISFNGIDDHDFVTPGGTYILDVETNADQIGGLDGTKKLPEGQLIYAKTSSNTNRLIMAGYY